MAEANDIILMHYF